jgi:hypothetical protein
MAYSKAELKSIGDRASPCFKPFLIGNLSDTFLPTWTLLYASARLIFYIYTHTYRDIRVFEVKNLNRIEKLHI